MFNTIFLNMFIKPPSTSWLLNRVTILNTRFGFNDLYKQLTYTLLSGIVDKLKISRVEWVLFTRYN